jgi:hypothetical protein
MNQKLADYLDDAFRMYRGSRAAEEMKQELLINLSDKFADFRRLGHSDETALRMTIDSIGDIAEMMEQIAHSIPGEPPTDTQANFSSSNLQVQTLRESNSAKRILKTLPCETLISRIWI